MAKMIPLLLYFGIFQLSLAMEISEVSQRGHVVVSEDEPGILSCKSDHFTECSWVLPNGVTCDVNENRRQCRSDPNIIFNGTDSLCQIRIFPVNEVHNGEWTCSLKTEDDDAEAKVTLTIGQKAEVDWFGGIWGSQELKYKENRKFGCEALHSRPSGSFIFHFGDNFRLPDNIIKNDPDMIAIEDNRGFWNVSQSVTFNASIEMDGLELFCTYLQFANGEEIFQTQKSVDLAVHALYMDPSAKREWPASTGDNITISLLFTALPTPEGKDVWWVIQNEGTEHEIYLEEEPLTVDHYIVYPIEKVSELNYVAKLTILNVTDEESDNKHFLKMTNKLSSIDAIDEEFQFWVLVDFVPLEPESTKVVVIIVIVIIVLLVAILIAVMLVVYAKKNNIWCYASSTKPYIKEDITERKEPLMKHHPYGRPTEK